MKYKILFLIIPIVVLLAGAGLGFAYYKHEQDENKEIVPASEIVVPEDSVTTNTSPTKQPGTYSVAEVQSANTTQKCWTVIRGKVYNLTSYINAHPGGEANIMQVCGKDGTATFDAQHSGQGKPEDKLASLYLGTLVK